MTVEQKAELAMRRLVGGPESPDVPRRLYGLLRELLEIAIRSEYVSVWSDRDVDELMHDDPDQDRQRLLLPYITTCGEPVGERYA